MVTWQKLLISVFKHHPNPGREPQKGLQEDGMDSSEKTSNDAVNEFYMNLRTALELNDPQLIKEPGRKGLFLSHDLDSAREARRRRIQKEEANYADSMLEQIEDRIKSEHIEQFVKEHFPNASFGEERYLTEAILKELDAGVDTDDEQCMEHFLMIGLDGIRKQRRREKLKQGAKKFFRYLWRIAYDLIALGLILAIYRLLVSPFETIAVSILLVIYTTISSHGMGSGLLFEVILGKADFQFLEVRKLLGKPATVSEKDAMESTGKKITDTTRLLSIDSFFLAIVDLIALWNVVKAIGLI